MFRANAEVRISNRSATSLLRYLVWLTKRSNVRINVFSKVATGTCRISTGETFNLKLCRVFFGSDYDLSYTIQTCCGYPVVVSWSPSRKSGSFMHKYYSAQSQVTWCIRCGQFTSLTDVRNEFNAICYQRNYNSQRNVRRATNGYPT